MSQYEQISRQFFENRLLFGNPDDVGIVAMEIASPTEVEVTRRISGKIVQERRPLKLFALLESSDLLRGFKPALDLHELRGDFRFRYLANISSTDILESLRRHLRNTTGRASSAPDAPYLVLSDLVEQHLMLAGSTFFMGLEFSDLVRLQLDIETYISPGFEFPSASRPGDRVIAISITDSRGYERVLKGTEMDEAAMLAELVRIVHERDPDVIEGHNLFRFDLEYLEARARRHRLKLGLGRGGAMMRARPARLQIAERSIAYRRFEIPGRSIIDTWILAQHYDIASRALEGFGLKQLAIHFGLARPDRVYLDASRVSEYFDRDPERLFEYALDDARETRALAEILSASYFMQARIFPYSYQNVVLRGNATRINALMMRAYLAAGHSIPSAQEPRPVAGGYTEIRRCGVARGVLHCDVTSLYPSLMLQHRLAPATDRLGVFLRMLADLRNFRVQAKTLARELSGKERRNMDALQQTFKILINSFYGYLGFSLGYFNDFDQAAGVTRRGRDLIRSAVAQLEEQGALVIEVDTDGIYFVPPPDAGDGAGLIEKLSMPEGIKLEIDGRYDAMFSYKMKNYVLLDETGQMTIRGSGLKSRGLERFQRRFMEEIFMLLLQDRHAEFAKLHEDWCARLSRHEIDIADLMKTETLQDSLDNYRQKLNGKRRNLSAAYELALKAQRPYQSGDQISYYITGRTARVKVVEAARMISSYDPKNPDENVAYYQAKLADLYEKFRPFAIRRGLFAATETDPDAAGSPQGEIFSDQSSEAEDSST